MADWNFPNVTGIGTNGFNNIGEEFKDKPIQALAKEICQNSLDAKRDDCNNPVKVEFKDFYMNSEDFPGYESFKKVLSDEYEYNNNYYIYDKTVPEFYKTALEEINKDQIYCLRISDFNTTGLTGSNKNNHSAWCDLTKNAGVSDKPAGSGGSKGQGKFASFISSMFYTVFYSSYAIDELKPSCGIARLSGYQLKNEEGNYSGYNTLGEGYYENNGMPIEGCLNFDPMFTREEYGTDLYIMGFKYNTDNWKEKIVASIIDDFFVAFVKNQLVVEIGEYVISRYTLDDLIINDRIKNEINPLTEKYYQILHAESDFISESFSMFEANDVNLKIMKDSADDSFSVNTVAVIRKTGMKILDLNYLPKLGFYHGVLEMNGDKVNDYFRKLENASHTNWSEDRGSNVNEARANIKALKDFVRNTIIKYLSKSTVTEIDAEGMGDFLPDENEFDEENQNDTEESVNNEEIKEIKIQPKKFKKTNNKEDKSKDNEGDYELVIDDNGDIHEIAPEPSPTPPFPTPPNPNPYPDPVIDYLKVVKPITLKKSRVIDNDGKYLLIIETEIKQDLLKLEINIYGESINEKAVLKNVSAKSDRLFNSNVSIETNDNEILINNVEPNVKYIISFEIESEELWTLEVNGYGNN